MKRENKQKQLERRRLQAGRWLVKGVRQAEVARRTGAAKSTVHLWAQQLRRGGLAALKSTGPRGRPSGLDATQRRELGRELKRGAVAHGFATELWTLARVGTLIQRLYGRRYSAVQVWRILGAMGWSAQRPSRRALERDEQAIREWKRKRWPALKKNALKQGRTLVFVDESGRSERPTRVRSWAPKGQTPVLQYHFNWHQLSVMAGVTIWRFYFRLFPGTIKGPQVVEFLQSLKRQLRRRLLVIWDGLPAHRSRAVKQYLEAQQGAIQIEPLPAYAPELNPAEYLWGHLKNHELANLCAESFGQLTEFARRRLKSMQRRPTLVRAFWQQAELPL